MKSIVYNLAMFTACFQLLGLLTGCQNRSEKQPTATAIMGASRAQVLQCSVMIIDNNKTPFATGFFVADANAAGTTNIFFVTAAHVYHSYSRGMMIDLKIRQRLDAQNYDFTVQAANATGSLCKEYNKGLIYADVLVIRVDNFNQIQQKAPHLQPYLLTSEVNPVPTSVLQINDSLLAVGMLSPITSMEHSNCGELLLRSTTVAALPQAPIRVGLFTSELIIADHQAWEGCSGAPVFSKNIMDDGRAGYQLIGLTSGYISRDYRSNGKDVHEGMPLAYVTPLKYIKWAAAELSGVSGSEVLQAFSVDAQDQAK